MNVRTAINKVGQASSLSDERASASIGSFKLNSSIGFADGGSLEACPALK